MHENEKDWEKVVAIYKNKKEIRTTKKYKRKRYTIEGWNNIKEQSNEPTQTHREKT